MSKHADPKTPKQPPAEADKKDIVNTQQRSLAVVDYGEDAGAGFQGQTKDESALPFLGILQPGSPEVLADESTVKAGTWVNRVTGEFYEGKKGIVVVGIVQEHCYVEWKPKKGPNGEQLKGGFVARHERTEPVCQTAREKSPFKAFRMENGNDLVETFYVPALVIDEESEYETFAPVMLSFSSTHIKAYKNWSYIEKGIMVPKPGGGLQNPPFFGHKYRLTTLKKVDGGNTWFVPVIGFAGKDAESSRLVPGDLLYEAAKTLKKQFLAGEVKVDYKQTVSDNVQADGEKPPF